MYIIIPLISSVFCLRGLLCVVAIRSMNNYFEDYSGGA
jgi:hypothetical protein